MDRRTLLGLTAALAATPALARAQVNANAQVSAQEGMPTEASLTLKPSLPMQDLWPGAAPGGEKVTATERSVLRKPGGDPNDTAFYNITKPRMSVRRPETPNGGAVLLIPGGGYVRVAVSKAGGEVDAWLAGLGYTVFTVTYRLPGDTWAAGPDVALQDAQRAVRLIRSQASQFGIDPHRLAIMGFSAGGHIAGLLATRFAEQTYAPIDAADRLSARPAVAALMYPVISMGEHAHKGSRQEILKNVPAEAVEAVKVHASVELHVPADAVPSFVGGTTDDPSVPAKNGILMYEALKAAKVPAELHLWEGNTHGFPLRGKDGQLLPWGPAALAFMQRHGLDA
ncbi:pectin acetylesterase [Asticcacaulis biprosthecium C19]|uniref:Pectin acetylesterase n=1 Tax=Asticcacaulis biprosthecium C19 TaxID=715226 RepID=F4QU58_9CAUL|nr:alpha/beta hydrolase [Asticcacaulis biprosthecium]EGF89358.1 pectin acetylesterase [Asticcacaulis biprosthecium C19]